MYKVLNTEINDDIISRILKVRNIQDNIDDFLNPSYQKYWQDPYSMGEVEKSIERIILAIEKNQKIMIFGDYDVDGVCSSYILYSFFQKFLKYKNISVRLPSRLEDGYGIKDYHFDEIKSKGVDLVITVDNGITAIQEAKYAKKLGIDLIVTDHHQALPEIPQAFALINPQVSDMRFKSLCGAGVAFKLCIALGQKLLNPSDLKKSYDFLLPIVSIATVADCMPLIDENRLLVKKGLEIMNSGHGMPKSLKNFLDYIGAKKINATTIGFQIAPRLNAGGRMLTPYDSFKCLITEDFETQKIHLDKLEEHNTNRRTLQDTIFKQIETQITTEDKILISAGEYHEGVIGIIAGKLTEKYQKPSCVIGIDEKKGIGVASLRAGEGFSIVDMLYQSADILERFGGHKRAGGFTVKIENLEKLTQNLKNYANNFEFDEIEKTLLVDTYLYESDLKNPNIKMIESLEPFGEGNPAPLIAVQNFEILDTKIVGKSSGHLKISGKIGNTALNALWRGKGSEGETLQKNITIIGSLKYSDYDKNIYIEIKKIFPQDASQLEKN